MDLPEMSRGAELLSALAGPAGGFMLFALHPVLPRLATAGLVQSVYNLLPVYPLDGGRIFRCILEMTLLPPKAQKLQKIVTILCCIGILTAGFYGWFALQYGPLCFLLSVLTVIRIK